MSSDSVRISIHLQAEGALHFSLKFMTEFRDSGHSSEGL